MKGLYDRSVSPEGDRKLLAETAAAAQAGEIDRAIELAEGALVGGLSHPLFLKLRSVKREREGRLPEAIADLRAALADAPDDFAARNALGLHLARLGRPRDGLQELERAIALNPEFAPAQLNRAWALETLGDLAGAEAAYRRAIEIDPRGARALAALAWLAARRGDWAEAMAQAEAALAIAPEPAARLARALTWLRQEDASASEGETRLLLTQQNLPPYERAATLWLLGEALDAQDRAAEAGAAYAASNGVLAGAYAAMFGSGQAGPTAFVERLATQFEAMASESWPKAPEAEPGEPGGPAFVLGFPGSGVELAGRLLAAHPKVASLDAQAFLAKPTAIYLEAPDGLDVLARADAAELTALRGALWAQAREADADACLSGRLPVQVLALNTLALPLIARLFADAKPVLVVRDPRDVVLSCFRQPFAPSRTNLEFLDLERAARFYDAVMRFAVAAEGALSLEIRRLRYEDLVESQEATARALCKFVGLRWSARLAGPGLLDLEGERPGRWRAHAAALEPVLPILQPWIDRFGYDHG